MAKGWKEIDGKWYYLCSTEVWQRMCGKQGQTEPGIIWDRTASCLRNTTTPDGYKVEQTAPGSNKGGLVPVVMFHKL